MDQITRKFHFLHQVNFLLILNVRKVSRNANTRTFEVDFPGPGKFSLEIFSKKRISLQESTGDAIESYELTLQYEITVSGNPGNLKKRGKFPVTFARFQKANFQLTEPLNGQLHANTQTHFHISGKIYV